MRKLGEFTIRRLQVNELYIILHGQVDLSDQRVPSYRCQIKSFTLTMRISTYCVSLMMMITIIVQIVTWVLPTHWIADCFVLFRRRYADTSWTLSKTANTDGSGSVQMAKSVTIDTLCHLVSNCSCNTKQCYNLVGIDVGERDIPEDKPRQSDDSFHSFVFSRLSFLQYRTWNFCCNFKMSVYVLKYNIVISKKLRCCTSVMYALTSLHVNRSSDSENYFVGRGIKIICDGSLFWV